MTLNITCRCLQVLLEYKAKVDTVDIEGHTPLFLALQQGHRKCAEVLMRTEATSLDHITRVGVFDGMPH